MTAEPTGEVSTPGPRIAELDVLRGFALCGILVVNIIQQLVWIRGVGRADYPTLVELLFVERFLSIFAVLFGVGFALFLDRAAARAPQPRLVLLTRLLVLLVIGGVHQFFHVGEVLLPYAAVGLLVLVPLSFADRWTTLVVGLGMLVVLPQLEEAFGLMIALLVLGFALGRLGVAEGLSRRPGRVAAVLAVSGGLTAMWIVLALRGPLPRVNVLGGGLGGTQNLLPPLAAAVAALAYCCLLLLVLRTPVGGAVGAVLAPMGRTALTNYLAATALFLTIGPLLGIDSVTDTAAITGLTVGILVVQAVWSRWWSARFAYGPVEWVWRCLTWGRRVPLRRGPPHGVTAAGRAP